MPDSFTDQNKNCPLYISIQKVATPWAEPIVTLGTLFEK